MKKSVMMRVVFAAMVVTLLLSVPTIKHALWTAIHSRQPPPPPQLKKWLVADGNPQPPRPPLSAMTV